MTLATHFYNDNNPRTAAWLRELIKAGHLPAGTIDRNSITDLYDDSELNLDDYVQCHFFAGIGGWPLALKLAGVPSTFRCWTGSCPCQPFNAAGRGLGEADPRHLWPAFRQLISKHHPPVIFGEQVASKAGRLWLTGVFADLEKLGYACAGADLCAACLGAPHIRQRLYWVAYNNRGGQWARGFAGRLAEVREGRADVTVSAEERSSHCGVADPVPAGWAERWTSPRNGQVAGGGGADGLAHAQRSGRHDRRWPSEERYGHSSGAEASQRPPLQPEAAGLCAADGSGGPDDAERLDNPNSHRTQRPGAEEQVADAGCEARIHPAWADHRWLSCLDGKARRTQPGLQPLAHGIPARVVRLRGYGNAIVPQLAAEFIRASVEAINEGLTPATP